MDIQHVGFLHIQQGLKKKTMKSHILIFQQNFSASFGTGITSLFRNKGP